MNNGCKRSLNHIHTLHFAPSSSDVIIAIMSVSKSDVAHLATLSSISLSDDELNAMTADLENIITYIEQLRELDTTGVEPTYQLTGLTNVWREDEVTPQLAREKLLALAQESLNNQVKVPKVL